MSNQTRVTTGVIAGSISTILWWYLSEYQQVDAPAEVVAASVALFTAALQWVWPIKQGETPNA